MGRFNLFICSVQFLWLSTVWPLLYVAAAKARPPISVWSTWIEWSTLASAILSLHFIIVNQCLLYNSIVRKGFYLYFPPPKPPKLLLVFLVSSSLLFPLFYLFIFRISYFNFCLMIFQHLFASAADEYSRQLEKRFPLCSSCQHTVHQAINRSHRYVPPFSYYLLSTMFPLHALVVRQKLFTHTLITL
jgi:hypothetical protein